MPTHPLRRRLLIAVLSPIVILSLLEVVLRTSGLSQVHARYFDAELGGTRFHPHRTCTMESYGQEMGVATTNGHGFRGPWFKGPKTPGVVRLAAIGDSVTFGWSVADDETLPVQISKLLDLSQIPHEIVNFGIPGYNTRNELALYEQVVRPHQPDVIVICVTPNDIEPSPPRPLYIGGALGEWFEGGGIYGALHKILRLPRGVLVKKATDPKYLQLASAWDKHGPEIRANPSGAYGAPLLQAWRADMDALLTATTGDGCKVLVVTLPCRALYREVRWSYLTDGDPLQLPTELMGWQREVAAACERAGVIHLDLLIPFSETQQVYGKIDKGHPTPRGHKVIARQATKKLVSLGWVRVTR